MAVKKIEERNVEMTAMYWAELENADKLERYLDNIVRYAKDIQEEVARLLEQPEKDRGKARYIATYAEQLMENTLKYEKEKEVQVMLDMLKRRQEKE